MFGKKKKMQIMQVTEQDLKDMGFEICEKCGAIMESAEDSYGNLIFRCPDCGREVFQDEYYSDPDDEEEDYPEFDSLYGNYGDDIPGEGCLACGGPYPDCKSSCPMFDD